jgi:hypothetical protein
MVLPELEHGVSTGSRVMVIRNDGENCLRRNGDIQLMARGKIVGDQVA